MNWRTESNHELPIRQACNSRPWNEAIGMQLGEVGGGCWNIYLHLSIFLPTRGIFFLSRPLGSARYFDRVLCSFYQNYLVHWFIPFSLPLSLSFSLSHSRVVARFVINVEITAREFQRGIGCHLLDRESTMNRSNLLFSREKRNRWMFQSGIRE